MWKKLLGLALVLGSVAMWPTWERAVVVLPLPLVARAGVWGMVRRAAGEADLGGVKTMCGQHYRKLSWKTVRVIKTAPKFKLRLEGESRVDRRIIEEFWWQFNLQNSFQN